MDAEASSAERLDAPRLREVSQADHRYQYGDTAYLHPPPARGGGSCTPPSSRRGECSSRSAGGTSGETPEPLPLPAVGLEEKKCKAEAQRRSSACRVVSEYGT